MPCKFPVKIFFDSDVVIAGSAAQTGASFLLLQLAELRLIKGCISVRIRQECTGNIQSKLPEALPYFNAIIDRCFDKPIKVQKVFLSNVEGQAHPKDIPILAAALQAQVSYLVTFNIKHYFPDNDLNIKIVTPKELLREIRESLSNFE